MSIRRFTIQSRDGRLAGSYVVDTASMRSELHITNTALRSHLMYERKTNGGVLAGPEGPIAWSAAVVVDYLRHSGYELVEEGDDGQHDSNQDDATDRTGDSVREERIPKRAGVSHSMGGTGQRG